MNDLSAPEYDRIDEEEWGLGEKLSTLERQRDAYERWSAQHPEAANRLDHLTVTIETLSGVPLDPILAAERAREVAWTDRFQQLALQRSRGLSRGLDLGL